MDNLSVFFPFSFAVEKNTLKNPYPGLTLITKPHRNSFFELR